jgi:hypothetical protein
LKSFHDDAVKFMADLLKLLQEQAKSNIVGDNSIGVESVYSVLTRLIGITADPRLQVDQNINYNVSGNSFSTPEDIQQEASTKDLLNNFLKSQQTLVKIQIEQLNNLLKVYRKRLFKYSKARQLIKLNRTKRLIDPPKNPLNAQSLVKDTLEQTSKNLIEHQQKLKKQGDLTGIILQDQQLQKALSISVDKSSAIPEDLGEFRNQLVDLLRSTAREADNKSEQIDIQINETEAEVARLQNENKLLFDGIETFSGDTQKLSLIKILDVLIFLTDKQKVNYKCVQCKYYKQGETKTGEKLQVCSFGGTSAASEKKAVNFKDQNGNIIVGQQTTSNGSCDTVWKLEHNNYYSPSESIITEINKILRS